MNLKEYSENIQRRSEIFAEVTSACFTLLNHHPCAKETKEYLRKRLPIKVPGFTFGYFPSNENLKYMWDYIDKSKLEEVGLIYNKIVYDGPIAQKMSFGILADNNLVVPYKNNQGDILGLVGRSILNDEQRKE